MWLNLHLFFSVGSHLLFFLPHPKDIPARQRKEAWFLCWLCILETESSTMCFNEVWTLISSMKSRLTVCKHSSCKPTTSGGTKLVRPSFQGASCHPPFGNVKEKNIAMFILGDSWYMDLNHGRLHLLLIWELQCTPRSSSAPLSLV